jgi:hypothetical protein
MAISTYAELQTAVANWINRTDLTDRIKEFIALGEARINRDLRIRAMEAALSETMSSGVVAVPSDYLDLKYAYIDGTPTRKLEYKTSEYIYDHYPTRSATSKPHFIAEDAGNFIFGAFPDSDYTVKGTYYKSLPALSDSNTTNWFTANASDLLLWAACLEAMTYTMEDERIELFAARYSAVKDEIQKAENRAKRAGSAMRSTPV